MNPSVTAATNARARLSKLRERLSTQGWSAIMVLDASDIAYLTGLRSSNAVLVVTPGEAHLATDFRYVSEAMALGAPMKVHQLDQGLYASLGRALGDWTGGGTVAYSPSSLSHRGFLQLTDELPTDVTLRAVEGVVGGLREIKETGELDAIRRAAALLDDAYAMICEHGLAGRTEGEVVWAIERFLREHGAERLSFDAIVAGGINGAFPHHHPGSDVIERDTLVTIDIGCVVDGYCSDCTRTFATGSLSDDLRRIYEITLEAQQAGLDAVRPGAVGRDVDAAARSIIERRGFGEYFGHGLGHGVGLEVHEAPRLARTSESVLEPGMVVTVEPGIYLPNTGGVRIEDLVVVTEGGCETLTNFPKTLTNVEE